MNEFIKEFGGQLAFAGFVLAVAIYLGFHALADAIKESFEQPAADYVSAYERSVEAQFSPRVVISGDIERDDDGPGFDLFGDSKEYPDPTESDLASPRFEAIWQAIKGWDISRDGGSTGYSSPTGNDVMHILNAIRPMSTAREEAWNSAIRILRDIAIDEKSDRLDRCMVDVLLHGPEHINANSYQGLRRQT